MSNRRIASKATGTPSYTLGEAQLLKMARKLSSDIIKEANFEKTLQLVKGKLFEKAYSEAFGAPENLKVYFARWVPARAVIFRRIFLSKVFPSLAEAKNIRFACLGAGPGSELMALASIANSSPSLSIEVAVVDVVDWSIATQGIAAEAALPDSRFSIWHRPNVDLLKEEEVESALGPFIPPASKESKTNVFTVMYTISELFIQSRAKTVQLLSQIGSFAKPGDLLLIVESADLSSITVGTNDRTYPLGFLLDHALGMADETSGWEKLKASESEWFRFEKDIATLYPLKLENSRVFIRLFKRLTPFAR